MMDTYYRCVKVLYTQMTAVSPIRASSEPRASSAALQSMNAYTGSYGEFGVSEVYALSPPQVTYPQPAPTHQAALHLQGEPSTVVYLSDNGWPSMTGLPTVHAQLTPSSPSTTLASTASSPTSTMSMSLGYFSVPAENTIHEISIPTHGELLLEMFKALV